MYDNIIKLARDVYSMQIMMSVWLIMEVVHSHAITLPGLITASVGMVTRWTMIATALVSYLLCGPAIIYKRPV